MGKENELILDAEPGPEFRRPTIVLAIFLEDVGYFIIDLKRNQIVDGGVIKIILVPFDNPPWKARSPP